MRHQQRKSRILSRLAQYGAVVSKAYGDEHDFARRLRVGNCKCVHRRIDGADIRAARFAASRSVRLPSTCSTA